RVGSSNLSTPAIFKGSDLGRSLFRFAFSKQCVGSWVASPLGGKSHQISGIPAQSTPAIFKASSFDEAFLHL
ncbi:hypothetical protein ACP3V5_15975, partial [Vibrio maritimus]